MKNSISLNLLNKIKNTEHLKYVIHSVFHNVINLIDNNGDLISFLNSNCNMQDNSIRFDINKYKWSIGDKAEIINNNLIFKNASILKLDVLEVYNSSITLTESCSLDILSAKNELMFDYLMHKGNRYGALNLLMPIPENKHFAYILPMYKEWIRSYRNKDEESLIEATKKICGFGIGLTPSMDDFLCGAILSCYCIILNGSGNISKISNFTKRIEEVCTNLTNKISYSMIKSACNFCASENVKALLRNIFSNDVLDLKLLNKIIDYGSSSGTDFLCGVVITLNYAINM